MATRSHEERRAQAHDLDVLDLLHELLVAGAALDDERQVDDRIATAEMVGDAGVAHVALDELHLRVHPLRRAPVQRDNLLHLVLSREPLEEHASEAPGRAGDRNDRGNAHDRYASASNSRSIMVPKYTDLYTKACPWGCQRS